MSEVEWRIDRSHQKPPTSFIGLILNARNCQCLEERGIVAVIAGWMGALSGFYWRICVFVLIDSAGVALPVDKKIKSI